MNPYDFGTIEPRWRRQWAEEQTYRTPTPRDGQETFYCLDFFPYPSGYGLSVGHGRNYVPSDVVARYRRMRGQAVLHPMGWDAFGLPAENEAMAQGTHPAESTAAYAANYRRQLDLLGCSYDWAREINSSDPAYYRWTQWLFLLCYRRGLAYRASAPVNWCETCQTVLADEEIEAGACWRCHQPVVQRPRAQWFMRITDYADELLADLDSLDWPESILTMQRNWIGRSAGVEITYHLRDWLISRQRYWGAPIPIVHCPACGEVPVPEKALPVRLPPLPDYRPRGDGRAPLANVAEFVHTACPRCGGPAERETDTMTGFMCSSWYYLRFASPHEEKQPFDPAAAARWLPVTMYMGGVEHAVGHLLYSRFLTKVMADAGLVAFREPFPVLRSQGVLHKRDPESGRIERMSKSRGNIVTPDSVVERYGADVTRLYILFIAPFEANATWEVDEDSAPRPAPAHRAPDAASALANSANAGGAAPQHIEGVRRFHERVWRLVQPRKAGPAGEETKGEAARQAGRGGRPAAPRAGDAGNHGTPPDEALRRALHRTVRDVTAEIEAMRYNTAISALMTYASALEDYRGRHGDTVCFYEARRALVLLLAPLAPFIAEEAWRLWGEAGSVHHQRWPEYDAAMARPAEVTVAVQVDGRVRERITVPADADEEAVRAAALAAPAVRRALAGRAVTQVIVVAGQVVNVVTRRESVGESPGKRSGPRVP